MAVVGANDDDEQRRRDRARAMIMDDEEPRKRTRRRSARDVESAIDARFALIDPNDPNGFERVVGLRDIVSVNFFERGLRAARAVCRVNTVAAGGGSADYATGFLASPGLLVTNNHVLPDRETASLSLAEFGYELDRNFVERSRRVFSLIPGTAFFTDAELDITIVAVSPIAHDRSPITDFGVLPLLPMSGKGLVGEFVSIIQHPGGGTKQVVVRENRIVALNPKLFPNLSPAHIHYTADTERGSSGSPVFNDQWDLIAVHHKAIDARDREGRPLSRTGKIWSPADGESIRDWIANEGVRVSAICDRLRRAAAFDADAARIVAMLAFEPRGAERRRRMERGEPAKWQSVPGVPDTGPFESTRFSDPAFAGSMGYDPAFLGAGHAFDPPKLGAGFLDELSTNSETTGVQFDYTHFSLAMHASRRLAVWTAVNIKGDELKSSSAGSGWRQDPRLAANRHTLAEVYGPVAGKDLQLDRGHLVRRLDPVWGPQDVADRAAADTYHYTNAAPQEHVYNSETWGNLEDFVLARADDRDHRASVMTGPILRPDDSFFGADLRGGPWQIPWSFWKIAIFVRPDETVSVTGFVVEQSMTLAPLFESSRYNPYSLDEARVFQRPIALIETLTGLDFGPLRGLDRMGDVESTRPEAARPIRDGSDIIF